MSLLRLNVTECEAVGIVFEREAVAIETRMLVLDVLAAAGTFEAQVVMRRLLSLAVARTSVETFAAFVQRLGIVECPDGPTLRFLMSVYAGSRSERHEIRAAFAYALGASAGRAKNAGDNAAAAKATEPLRSDLSRATSSVEKCALLVALGNAGLAVDVAMISRLAEDDDASIRTAAAVALRRMNDREARARLIVLLGDRVMRVARSALAGLSEQALEDDDREQLAARVLVGATSLTLDGPILRLLVAPRTSFRGSANPSPRIEAALRLLVARVESPAPDARAQRPASPSRAPSPYAIVRGR